MAEAIAASQVRRSLEGGERERGGEGLTRTERGLDRLWCYMALRGDGRD